MEKINCRLIIGLGNPGKEYEKTYHNIGLSAVDFLKIPEFQIPASKKFEYAKINGRIFVKSLSFMNESGKTVVETVKYFSVKGEKIKPEEILVIHDDSDIELGKYKLSFGRASAGHLGVESIIKALKTKNFWRLRIGIRPKISSIKHQASSKRTKAGEFVLKKISPSDIKIFNILLPSLTRDRVLSFLFSPAIRPPRLR